MGIYPQPNTWQCGPFALKHALLTLGIVEHERKLTRVSGANEDGADTAAINSIPARAALVTISTIPGVAGKSSPRT